MKRRVFLGALFLLVLLASAVVHLPATLFVRYVPLAPGMVVEDVSGTVWNGTVNRLGWQGRALGVLTWQFKPLSLLIGKADVALRVSGNPALSVSGNVGYGLGGVYATDLLASASAAFVQSFIPNSLPVSLSGQFDLTVRNYQTRAPLCEVLAGNLAWTQGSVTSPLGSIDPGVALASLACGDNGQVLLNGDSKSDAVTTEFDLTLTPDQRYSVRGWFIPSVTFPEAMRNQLGWLGQPDNEGRYRFSFSG